MGFSRALVLLLLSLTFVAAQSPPPRRPGPAKVDVNAASQAELEALPAVGVERARWIIATRERNGPFRCVEELRAMPRLSERQYRALQPRVFVEDPDPRCDAKSVQK